MLDIILMVNIILETYEPNNQELWLADINEDGYINIQDIITTIQIILN